MKFCRQPYYTAMIVLAVFLSLVTTSDAAESQRVELQPDVSPAYFQAVSLGRVAETEQVETTLTLPLRNGGQLDDLLRRQSDPSDPEYGLYLTPAQFVAQFGPTQAEYDAVAAFARSEGLTVTATHANRLLLDVSGPRDAVENAFGVHLYWYQGQDGRIFHAPDSAPSVPATLSGVVSGVVGLSDAALVHPYLIPRNLEASPNSSNNGIGTGPQGGLAPSDIRTAYGLSGVSLKASGQTLADFELDGYSASDIAGYESQFGLSNVPLQNVLIDGATGQPGSNADEVTLDIEMQLALASDASKIIVYETQNTNSDILDGYSRIADDDLAKEVSTSWGIDEQANSTSFMQSENTIFKQMAAQGQTIFAAAGDDGAYDAGSVRAGLSVDDPGAQPYVCCAGGTTLTTQSPGGPWQSETTWDSGSIRGGAGGGGASSIWPIPTWQTSAITSASSASSTMRNVPDVSLDSDPNSGYSIYFQGNWTVYGGTSCCAPLWAAFFALVNQQLASDGKPVIGQASPALYPILSTSDYTQDFHDIADGSNNLYYVAVTGYDDATGLGTLNGANLLAALVSKALGTPLAPPKSLSAVAGNGRVTLTWDASAGATSYDVYRSTTSGSGYTKIGSSTALSYTDSSVTNGKTYYYVVTAVDASGASTDSNVASATPTAPATVIATFPAGINFISLPYDYGSVSLASVLGYSDPILAVWDPATYSYVLSPNSPADRILLGTGYWARFPQAVSVTQKGTAASTTTDFAIKLSAGWNQIGDPFTAGVSLSKVDVASGGHDYSYADAVSAGLIGTLLYRYDTGTNAYVSVAASGDLEPDTGYFIDAPASVTLEVSPP